MVSGGLYPGAGVAPPVTGVEESRLVVIGTALNREKIAALLEADRI